MYRLGITGCSGDSYLSIGPPLSTVRYSCSHWYSREGADCLWLRYRWLPVLFLHPTSAVLLMYRWTGDISQPSCPCWSLQIMITVDPPSRQAVIGSHSDKSVVTTLLPTLQFADNDHKQTANRLPTLSSRLLSYHGAASSICNSHSTERS